MANDGHSSEEQQEREFLAGLKARSGRDLAGWMAAIAAKGFSDKNEIIDWLRTEGFPFARASWLERIHRNGGKPIHAGSATAAESDPAGLAPGHNGPKSPAAAPRPVATPPKLVVVPPAPRPQPSPAPAMPQLTSPPQPAPRVAHAPPAIPSAPRPPAEPGVTPAGSDPVPASASDTRKPAKKAAKPPPRVEAGDQAPLEKLVAAAKGYRPLYHHLEVQIRRAIPGAVIAARDRYIAIGAPLEFAAINPLPTEVRLGIALGDRPFDARLLQAKLRGPGPGITHMVVLTDARQVNDELLALLKAANARVNA